MTCAEGGLIVLAGICVCIGLVVGFVLMEVLRSLDFTRSTRGRH